MAKWFWLLSVFSLCASEFRGRQFICLEPVEANRASEWFKPAIAWDELVVSWNYRGSAALRVEAQVSYSERETKWYCLGEWSAKERRSVRNQRDEDGTVSTDTLRMKTPGGAVRLRVTAPEQGKIDLVALSFCDSRASYPALPPNTNAWGKTLTVEERTQADFPEGISEWCSPTALSMLLSFWAGKLGRADLLHTVPEVAQAVHDPQWPGTGNWPFNTAFAGAHPGMRAYVARFSDVSEIEDWIAAGIPLAFSASYGLLKGQTERGNGHLLVAIGFTDGGDIVVNDPGRRQVRQTYKRENLLKAWAESENTVYLVYPEGFSLPADRFGHWR